MADNTPTSASEMLNGAAAQAHRSPEEIAEEHNLLPKLLPHLDRHLIFPLLQFVADQEDEPSPETTKAKYELLKTTNMTDYVASLYCEIEGVNDPPAQFATKRQEVLDRLEKYEQESSKITDLLSREDVITNLRSDKVANLEYLKKEHEVCCIPLVGKAVILSQYRSQ
jgi:translation initiation factor 3 subunit E